MFTVEKFTVKQNAYDTAKKMIKAQHKKMKFLGSGCFGSVFGAKDSDIVYKIGEVENNAGYLAFIKTLAKQKKQNAFMPKVFGVRYIKDKDGEEVFVVAMEKLTELKHGMYSVVDCIEELLGAGGDDGYSDDTRSAEKSLGILHSAHSISDYGVDWDLHSGNFMMRGKQVVCTDPLA
jgi:hypothetical protein